MPLLVIIRRGDQDRQREDPLGVYREVELVAEIIPAAVPPDHRVGIREAYPAVIWVSGAPGLDEARVEDRVNLLDVAPSEEHDHLLLDDQLKPLGSNPSCEAADDGPGVSTLVTSDEAEPSDSPVYVEDPCELSEASDAFHAHH